MNTIPSGIGTRIRDARKAAWMSQTVLGRHLNKTLRTIQKYESGEIEPAIATINEFAKILSRYLIHCSMRIPTVIDQTNPRRMRLEEQGNDAGNV